MFRKVKILSKQEKIGGIILIVGLILYFIVQRLDESVFREGYFKSDITMILIMPVMITGLLFLILKKKDLKIGLFAKILLSLILITWAFVAVSLIIELLH